MIKLYRYLDKFTSQIVAIIVLIFLQVIANLYLPTLSSDIIDKGIVNNDLNYIIRIGGLMLLISAGGFLCSAVYHGWSCSENRLYSANRC